MTLQSETLQSDLASARSSSFAGRRRGASPSGLSALGASAWSRSLVCLALLLLASPAMAYIVVLKDGSQITTDGKYRIEGDKVIVTLPSGTQAFYDASEIDVAKTESLNKVNYGNARLIEGQKVTQIASDARIGADRSLGELVGRRELALPEPRRRDNNRSEARIRYTPAGFVDLVTLPRKPPAEVSLRAEVLSYLQGQGIDGVKVFAGSAEQHLLLEVITVSEVSVFKALEVASAGLQQIHQRFPDQVAAFELLMQTEDGSRAGQFVLTPELAELLLSKRIDTASFFLRYVEF